MYLSAQGTQGKCEQEEFKYFQMTLSVTLVLRKEFFENHLLSLIFSLLKGEVGKAEGKWDSNLT